MSEKLLLKKFYHQKNYQKSLIKCIHENGLHSLMGWGGGTRTKETKCFHPSFLTLLIGRFEFMKLF